MKIFSLLLAIFAVAILTAPETFAKEPSPQIRIITWNVEWYPGKFRKPTPEQEASHRQVVASSLAKMNPDIFLAQEIRDWESFNELCQAVPGLRPATVSAFVAEDTGEYWPQQVAIASKLPVVAAWAEPWKAGAEIQPRRGFAAAALRLEDGRLLLVYSLHLKSNRSASPEQAELNFRTRDESIRQLLDHVKQMETVVFPGHIAGVVLGGDFNTNGDGQFGDHVVAMLREAGFHHTWEGVAAEKRPTWRGNQQFSPATFDHFFTRGLPKSRARMLKVPEEASDHQPVLLRIPSLPPGSGASNSR